MGSPLHITVGQNPAELKGPNARLDWLEQSLQVLSTDILILPELFLTGYNIGDNTRNNAEDDNGIFTQKIANLAQCTNTAIAYGYPEICNEETYNTANFIGSNGLLIAKHRKLLLPPGFEGDYFKAGSRYTQFDYRGFKIAILICYDAEFPETFRTVSAQGAQLVIVPTALNADWGVVADKMMPTRAFENGVYLAYANQAGVENEMRYYGGSCIIAPNGDELARAGRKPELISTTINQASIIAAQTRLPYHQDLKKLPKS